MPANAAGRQFQVLAWVGRGLLGGATSPFEACELVLREPVYIHMPGNAGRQFQVWLAWGSHLSPHRRKLQLHVLFLQESQSTYMPAGSRPGLGCLGGLRPPGGSHKFPFLLESHSTYAGECRQVALVWVAWVGRGLLGGATSPSTGGQSTHGAQVMSQVRFGRVWRFLERHRRVRGSRWWRTRRQVLSESGLVSANRCRLIGGKWCKQDIARINRQGRSSSHHVLYTSQGRSLHHVHIVPSPAIPWDWEARHILDVHSGEDWILGTNMILALQDLL